MAVKDRRIEARLAADEQLRISRAAEIEQTSTGSFMVKAALERADRVIATADRTVVPSEYFDALVAALDRPGRVVPELERAMERARRHRIDSP